MIQVPAATPETVVPLTVQTEGVVELNVTANPEVAVAEIVEVPLTDSVVGVKVVMPIL